jgi:prepilin-type N-terminal cleavage/methylation domain-containing protein
MNRIPCQDDPDGQAGFTLIELLVTLALTAAIASFIIGGFHLVRRASLIVNERERAEEIDAAAAQLRGLLARAMPVTTIDEADGVAHLLFEGRRDEITFVALSEATAFQGGLMRIRLLWQDRPPAPGRPAALVLRTAVFRANPRLVFESAPVVLFRDVTEFSLRYFGAPEPGKRPQWHSEWFGRDQMPLAMLVQADLASGSGMRRLMLQSSLRLTPMN